jgi:hypothetical protein
MKTALLFVFTCLAYFAQAQTHTHRHEFLVGKGLLIADAHLGYRYHFSDRLAVRVSYYTWGSGYSGKGSSYLGVNMPKIGAQWATSGNPFHALLLADIALPFTKSESVNYQPYNTPSFKSNSKGTGVGIALGVGAEWIIKHRVALQLFTQPTFCNVWAQGTQTYNGVEQSFQNQYPSMYGDILSFSVGYRFL